MDASTHRQPTTIKHLTQTVLNQQALLKEKQQLLDEKQHRIELLEEYIRLQKHKQFGRSSEKHAGQNELFNEVELEASDDIDQVTDSLPSALPHQITVKKKPGRKPLPADLPRVRIELNLADADKVGALETFYSKVKEELDRVPARVQVLEYWQEKAVFGEGDDPAARHIKAAPLPKPMLPKTLASHGLLAYVVSAKYCDGLPLYRLEKILQRYQADLSRATLANWVIGLSVQLQPLVNLMQDHLLSGPLIQADETPIQMLKEKDKPPDSKRYMWVQVGGQSDQAVILFDYDRSRSKQVPLRLFAGYRGYLQTDGYEAYSAVCQQESITQLGCWDHARRKFMDAKKGQPKNKKKGKKGKTGNTSKAEIALDFINRLYAIEGQIKLGDPEEKRCHRRQHSLPVLAQLEIWLDKMLDRVAKESLTGKALHYLKNQWPKLIVTVRMANCISVIVVQKMRSDRL